jgi:RNA polymerase sigma factor (sigma-70 family)
LKFEPDVSASITRKESPDDPDCHKHDLARRAGNAFSRAMNQHEPTDGLQRVLLNERHRLLRFLAARGAGDEAEDLLHDLWQRIEAHSGQPIGEPVSYLFRAAENLLRDRRRSHVSRERRQFEWQEVSTSAEEEPLGERVLIARAHLREVETTLDALGPRVAQVFRMFRLEGTGQAAIARELGISLSSVEKDLQKAYHAIARLKAKFDAE